MRVEIDYTNWRGERGKRIIVPISIFFGASEWHKEAQWLLNALDTQKREYRVFAMKDIHCWNPVSEKNEGI